MTITMKILDELSKISDKILKTKNNSQDPVTNNSEILTPETENLQSETENLQKKAEKKQRIPKFDNRFLDLLYVIGLKIMYLVFLAAGVTLLIPVLWFVIVCIIAYLAVKVIFFW
jgi:hypothetical protein